MQTETRIQIWDVVSRGFALLSVYFGLYAMTVHFGEPEPPLSFFIFLNMAVCFGLSNFVYKRLKKANRHGSQRHQKVR